MCVCERETDRQSVCVGGGEGESVGERECVS